MSERSYRKNVAIAIIKHGRILLLERVKPAGNWQVPQGGIDKGEAHEEAMWRELLEETGITSQMARIRAATEEFLSYDIPQEYRRKGGYIGQKQKWYLLNLQAEDNKIHFNNMTHPEFSAWDWCSYWSAMHYAISFKKDVYRRALLELLPEALKLGV